MSFSAFLTGTVLVSSLALTGLLAAPKQQEHNRQIFTAAAGLALVVLGFVGGWFLAG